MVAVLQGDGRWRYRLTHDGIVLVTGYGDSEEEARLDAQRRWLHAPHTPTVAEMERQAVSA